MKEACLGALGCGCGKEGVLEGALEELALGAVDIDAVDAVAEELLDVAARLAEALALPLAIAAFRREDMVVYNWRELQLGRCFRHRL